MWVASPVVPEDDSTVEERLAIRLIRESEDLVHVERLEPPGSVPTPDWRVTAADGRIADVEVVWDTNQAGRRFESQLAEERPDDEALVRRRSRKEWPDARLSLVWDVEVYDDDPDDNKRPVKELVQALIVALAEVEARGGTPEQMTEAARKRLVDAREHLDNHDWLTASRQESVSDVSFDEFLILWGQETDYWYPQLLVDDHYLLARHVHVLRAAEPEEPKCGMVRTSPVVPDFAVGKYQHMLATVQRHIDEKTARRQMEHSPGLRWLFVILDDNMAAVQLDDYFGPACQELEVRERCPYHVLDALTFDYFDEVWVTGRSFHDRHHIVLRLSNTGDAPQHKIVRRAEVLAS